ncbi:hypothetical protein [Phytohabitans houttuyneae]|uniref:Uncharacterized protein n=1 Tax=Phytohabitans houttuyneae TaxID=1076126 RepID=A0A6V8JXP6_9ACTN|nr:hypothetical protein [Phytohabitans houttuyneae]GFJ77502.1 hypothetical protein Phou_016820 [Phytohabitans houttuyneae]
MTATEPKDDVSVVPGNALRRLRHDWLTPVLRLGCDRDLKQVVRETVTTAGRRPPQLRSAVERR